MARGGGPRKDQAGNGANLGFEAKLWEAADKVRNNEVLGLFRDTLLPKILSGALRVPVEAEPHV